MEMKPSLSVDSRPPTFFFFFVFLLHLPSFLLSILLPLSSLSGTYLFQHSFERSSPFKKILPPLFYSINQTEKFSNFHLALGHLYRIVFFLSYSSLCWVSFVTREKQINKKKRSTVVVLISLTKWTFGSRFITVAMIDFVVTHQFI